MRTLLIRLLPSEKRQATVMNERMNGQFTSNEIHRQGKVIADVQPFQWKVNQWKWNDGRQFMQNGKGGHVRCRTCLQIINVSTPTSTFATGLTQTSSNEQAIHLLQQDQARRQLQLQTRTRREVESTFDRYDRVDQSVRGDDLGQQRHLARPALEK